MVNDKVMKWLGTAAVVFAAIARANDFHAIDLVLSLLGAGLWVFVALKSRDGALLTVNAFIICAMTYGLFVSH